MQVLLSIFEYVIDMLFPKRCAGCNKIGTFLCAQCIQTIPPPEPPKEPFISAVFDYRHKIVKRAIWRFKYKNVRGLAKTFGENLHSEIVGDLGENLHFSKMETFLVVPIPLHAKRLRERGYNQSELIAHALLHHDVNKLFELSTTSLIRTRATKPQARSDKRSARLANLRGAFQAVPKTVYGKNIILIDDVTTTGATLGEARKILLRAGARSVRAYAVAH